MTSHSKPGSIRRNELSGRPDQSTVELDVAPSRSCRHVVLLGVVFPSVWRRRLKFFDLRRRLPGLQASGNAAQIVSLRRIAFLRWSGVRRSSIIGAVILVV